MGAPGGHARAHALRKGKRMGLPSMQAGGAGPPVLTGLESTWTGADGGQREGSEICLGMPAAATGLWLGHTGDSWTEVSHPIPDSFIYLLQIFAWFGVILWPWV